MFCKEQIYIDHAYTWELKQIEKAVLHFSNAGYPVDRMELIGFCRDWFLWKHQQELLSAAGFPGLHETFASRGVDVEAFLLLDFNTLAQAFPGLELGTRLKLANFQVGRGWL